MNWDRIRGGWQELKRRAAQRGARRARERQIAEWLARQHKLDPIHK